VDGTAAGWGMEPMRPVIRARYTTGAADG